MNIAVVLAGLLASTGCDQHQREGMDNGETHISATQAVQRITSDGNDNPAEQPGTALSRFNDAKLYCLGMTLYATKNRNLFPTNLNQTLPQLREANLAPSGTNRFEILNHGSLDQFTNSVATSAIVVIRSEPWQRTEGKWTRIYGFADGHCEAHSEADGNFRAWERQHSPGTVTGTR